MKIWLLFLGIMCLSACSPSSETDAPTPPAPLESDLSVLADPEPPEIKRISDIDFPSYSKDLARFVKLEAGESFASAKAKMEIYFIPGKGIPGEKIAQDRRRGPSEVSFMTFEGDGGKVILAERNEMADDSVKAEQMYALTKTMVDGSDVLLDYGMKIKCWRGESPDEWGTNLCP
ncbi:MAG: hypothetical protein ACSHXY_08610 [Alphaproteobacteria bacterium]